MLSIIIGIVWDCEYFLWSTDSKLVRLLVFVFLLFEDSEWFKTFTEAPNMNMQIIEEKSLGFKKEEIYLIKKK